MTFDEITARRRALYQEGGIELRVVPGSGGSRGEMVETTPGDLAARTRALEYNDLAARHGVRSR